MIFLSLVSFLVSLVIGVLMTCLLLPAIRQGAAGILFRLFVGAGLGIGVTSCLYFICLVAGIARYAAAIDLALCALLGLLCITLYKKRPGRGEPFRFSATAPFSGFQLFLAAIFSVQLVASLLSFAVAFLKEPHGRWDAWLIWNMHARFLYRGGEVWREAFASGLDWSHWDYPLLLPLSIARGWTYMGGESVPLSAAIAFLFTFLIIGLLLCSLSLLKSSSQGVLAAMILMGTPFFITLGASQFADVPFAFFVLVTIIMLFFQGQSSPDHQAGPLVLAGIACGMSAWTKNEGLLFMVMATLSLAGTEAYARGWRNSLKQTGRFLAGALPVLMVVLYFKTRISPANDLMTGFTLSAVSTKLLDWGRYAEIVRAFLITGLSFTQGRIDIRIGMHLNPGAVSILLLVAYLLLAGIRIDEKDRKGLLNTALLLLLIFAGYFFVYVMTPLDLNYHLVTSLNRLFLQFWPSTLFLFFMAASAPEGTPPAEGKSKQGTERGKKPKRSKEPA
jgi:hypothetical protein